MRHTSCSTSDPARLSDRTITAEDAACSAGSHTGRLSWHARCASHITQTGKQQPTQLTRRTCSHIAPGRHIAAESRRSKPGTKGEPGDIGAKVQMLPPRQTTSTRRTVTTHRHPSMCFRHAMRATSTERSRRAALPIMSTGHIARASRQGPRAPLRPIWACNATAGPSARICGVA